MLTETLPKDWAALGTMHNLGYYDIESLMECRTIILTEAWHLSILQERLQAAIVENKYDDVLTNVCLLIRAEMMVAMTSSGLGAVVLELALRDEKYATLEEGICIRLARVLAVKLDKLRQIKV
tara:strand:+ start:1037 stop:1405 length:369 start_codon:yes stop_codon:yes gene_type:complete